MIKMCQWTRESYTLDRDFTTYLVHRFLTQGIGVGITRWIEYILASLSPQMPWKRNKSLNKVKNRNSRNASVDLETHSDCRALWISGYTVCDVFEHVLTDKQRPGTYRKLGEASELTGKRGKCLTLTDKFQGKDNSGTKAERTSWTRTYEAQEVDGQRRHCIAFQATTHRGNEVSHICVNTPIKSTKLVDFSLISTRRHFNGLFHISKRGQLDLTMFCRH